MKCHVLPVILLGLACGVTARVGAQVREIAPDDTFANRIHEVEHVGLSTDDKLGGYILYLYTPPQFKENLASLATYRQEWDAFVHQLRLLDERRRAATSADISSTLVEERKKVFSARPNSRFAAKETLYTVSHQGADYLELRKAENPKESVLIPLWKISKVVSKDSDTKEDSEKRQLDDRRPADRSS
ncbi:hypothetical protein [Aeoliella sp.]|uniref:hypothetical protein n=1 Tax=Aeoliella sp. TaxID=2795800 RepID=UPI003CCC0627